MIIITVIDVKVMLVHCTVYLLRYSRTKTYNTVRTVYNGVKAFLSKILFYDYLSKVYVKFKVKCHYFINPFSFLRDLKIILLNTVHLLFVSHQ